MLILEKSLSCLLQSSPLGLLLQLLQVSFNARDEARIETEPEQELSKD